MHGSRVYQLLPVMRIECCRELAVDSQVCRSNEQSEGTLGGIPSHDLVEMNDIASISGGSTRSVVTATTCAAC